MAHPCTTADGVIGSTDKAKNDYGRKKSTHKTYIHNIELCILFVYGTVSTKPSISLDLCFEMR